LVAVTKCPAPTARPKDLNDLCQPADLRAVEVSRLLPDHLAVRAVPAPVAAPATRFLTGQQDKHNVVDIRKSSLSGHFMGRRVVTNRFWI
jgi:hypothetical protein